MGGVGQDRANIDSLLRGEIDPYEIGMKSAESAIGGGTPGSGFAQAGRYRLLDSEKLQRQQLGHQELEPYTNREHQAMLQSQAERARMGEIQAESDAAMERLRLSESGQGERLSQEERARLEQIAAQGQQSIELAKLNQKGNQDQTLLGGAFNLIGRLGSGSGSGVGGNGTSPRFNSAKYGGQAFNYTTDTEGNVTSGTKPPPDYWTPSGGTDRNVTNFIRDILKRYNFRSF
jgi:hypothetical protein